MQYKKFSIPLLLLAASLGLLLLIEKTPLAGMEYHNTLAHSFILLAFTAVLFFIWFFSYQRFVRDKDLRWYFLSVAFFVRGVFAFAHAVLVPAFGWGNEALFDISEHYGLFLASLLLWGLIIPFPTLVKDKIYQARSKIFLSINLVLLAGFASLFFLPHLAEALFSQANFFIVLTGIGLFSLSLVLISRQEDNFFFSSLPKALVLLAAATLPPLFYQEWNLTWWYFHLLELSALLLLLLRAAEGTKRQISEILFSSFSIRTRLFFIIGLTLIAIVVNGAIDFRLSQNHLKTQTMDNLVLIADLQEGQVLNWLDKLKGRTVDFSSDGFINDSLKKILSGDYQERDVLSRHLLENKIVVDSEIVGIHIMDVNGRVVASSRGSEVGMEDMAPHDYEIFLQAKGARYAEAYLSDFMDDVHFGEKNLSILATAPIIDQDRLESSSDQKKSENIGVIMLFFKTNELLDILTGKAQTELGALSTWATRNKTMETYLVNQDKLMVTESRFIVNAPMKQKVDTVPVRLCGKSEEMAGEYLDYRQIPVLGASMCFPNGWTLLVEIDKDEVLASLGDYLQQNLVSGTATFLLILIAMYLFSIGIIAPLKELSGVAQKIGKGDFTARATLVTRDEFGELSRIFNQMAENIQKGSAGLEVKVKEEETSRLAMSNILGDLEVAKNQLVEEKAKDEAILASIGDAVMACNKDGRIMLFNGVAQALTGFSSKEVIGNHYRQILHLIKESDQKPGNDFIAEAIKTGRGTTMANHTLLIAKDGQKIPVADSAAPIKDATGNLIGCVVVFRDVTHERDVDKAKTEFVSLASHQLRTPLTSINWYVEMLQAGDAGALNDKQKEFLSEVYKGSKRMVQLVSDLLNVSRLETGRLKIEPVPIDLVAFIGEVKKELEPQIVGKGCHVSLEFPKEKVGMVNADKVLLRQVISNLLTNAIRYSSGAKTGQVVVTLAVNAKEYTISVGDNGIGIPKEVQSKIFEKFFRADNARTVVADGNGLGLYLAKQIMESSGGTIGFSSSVGSGSTFYATIPLSGMKSKTGEKGLEG